MGYGLIKKQPFLQNSRKKTSVKKNCFSKQIKHLNKYPMLLSKKL